MTKAPSRTHGEELSVKPTDTADINDADVESHSQRTSTYAGQESHHPGKELAQADLSIDQPHDESVDPIAKEDYSTFSVGQ